MDTPQPIPDFYATNWVPFSVMDSRTTSYLLEVLPTTETVPF